MHGQWVMTVACGLAVMLVLGGPATAQYSGGSGDPNDPWQIADSTDLIAMGLNISHYGDAFVLTADIDMAGAGPEPDGSFTVAVIAPSYSSSSGFVGHAFTGTLDGAGHVIRNLVIDAGGGNNNYLGLFGYIYIGEVRNLGIEDSSVTGTGNYVGGLVGKSYYGTLTSCYATGAVTGTGDVGGLVGGNTGTLASCHATGAVSGGYFVGGLVGSNDGLLTSSYATGAVIGTDYNVGGLVGINTGTVTSCYATGEVIGDWSVGGLVGYSHSNGTLTSCHATGEVTGDGSVGGLLGKNYYGTLTSCYATGAVTGTDDVGGLVGDNSGTLASSYASGAVIGTGYNVGGLVGYNTGTVTSCCATGAVISDWSVGGLVGYNTGMLTFCYATGTVTGGNRIGGLVGRNDYGTVMSCYATGAARGTSDVGGLLGDNDGGSSISCYFLDTAGPDNGYGRPLRDEAMRRRANFLGWDFVGAGDGGEDTWAIYEGITAPYLSWQSGLVGSMPFVGQTLTKKEHNVIWLSFDSPIAIGAQVPLQIVPITGGDDVGGDFIYSVHTNGATLKAVENGQVLANQTWYRITPTASFAVDPFVYDVCTLIGDANGDGRVMAVDLAVIWNHNGEITDARYDINGDGRVMAVDLGVAWSYNGLTAPPKP